MFYNSVSQYMKARKTEIPTFILILLTVLLSVILILLSLVLAEYKVLSAILQTIGISGFASGIFSFVSDRIHTNRVEEILESGLPVWSDVSSMGIKSVAYRWPFDDDDFKEDFINSKDVIILMNDGKNFISNYKEILRKRFSIAGLNTTFILLDYGQSDVMSVLTRKNGHDADKNYYSRKIAGVVSYDIKDLLSQKDSGHILTVYLNSNYQPVAGAVTDHFALYSIISLRFRHGGDKITNFC